MRRFLLLVVVALVVTATPAAPAAADRADCSPKLEKSYSHYYKKVRKRHGVRAPGRNIRKHGVLFRKVTFDATCGELRRSRGQLKKLLAPPYYTLYTNNVPPAQPPAGVQSAEQTGQYGGWAIPAYIVMCAP